MRILHAVLLSMAWGAVLFCGCTTPAPRIQPLTKNQIQSFYKNAKDPRRYWITVYRSKRGPVFENVDRVHPEQFSVLPFKSPGKSSAPVVEVDAGGSKRFATLIDSTAARSWVSMSSAGSFNLIPLGPPAYRYRPKQVADKIPGYLCVATKLRFDQLNMESALICARAAFGPLGPLARQVKKPAIKLVLGTDILKAFSFVQIDYPNRRLIISSSEAFTPHQASILTAIPYQRVAGAIAVKGRVNKQPRLILIDTAGDFEFATKDPSVEELGELSIGDLKLYEVSVNSSAEQQLGLTKYPRIGRRILRNYRITLDEKKRMLYIERPIRAIREHAVDMNPLGD